MKLGTLEWHRETFHSATLYSISADSLNHQRTAWSSMPFRTHVKLERAQSTHLVVSDSRFRISVGQIGRSLGFLHLLNTVRGEKVTFLICM